MREAAAGALAPVLLAPPAAAEQGCAPVMTELGKWLLTGLPPLAQQQATEGEGSGEGGGGKGGASGGNDGSSGATGAGDGDGSGDGTAAGDGDPVGTSAP